MDKALFFVRKTWENNWGRDALLHWLGTDLYERDGKAITNFQSTLPAVQSDLAQQITKDPYQFDFLTIRETLRMNWWTTLLVSFWNLERDSPIWADSFAWK